MMNAKEAREMAERVNSVTNNATINTIEKNIKTVSAEGKYSVQFHDEISDIVKNHFKDLGYSIGIFTTGPNEECYLISW